MNPDPISDLQEFINGWQGNVLGRVFTHAGALHFVLEVDDRTGLCRVSRRCNGRTEIVHMPLGEVVLHIKRDIAS